VGKKTINSFRWSFDKVRLPHIYIGEWRLEPFRTRTGYEAVLYRPLCQPVVLKGSSLREIRKQVVGDSQQSQNGR